MSAQATYERYWDRLMDKDLAQGFHSYCEQCGSHMGDQAGYICEKCLETNKKKEIEETP